MSEPLRILLTLDSVDDVAEAMELRYTETDRRTTEFLFQ